jgi:hypothetical protein
LDLVEVHLVREISARSDSFFEALDQLEDLNRRIVGACDQIGELQGTVRLLDSDIVDSARHLQGLEMRRDDMLELHQKLKLLAYVNQAMSTLRLVCLLQTFHLFSKCLAYFELDSGGESSLQKDNWKSSLCVRTACSSWRLLRYSGCYR